MYDHMETCVWKLRLLPSAFFSLILHRLSLAFGVVVEFKRHSLRQHRKTMLWSCGFDSKRNTEELRCVLYIDLFNY